MDHDPYADWRRLWPTPGLWLQVAESPKFVHAVVYTSHSMIKSALKIIKEAGFYWWRNRAGPLAASLSYCTLASLGPLVVILLSISGAFFDRQAIDQVFLAQIESTVGQENTVFLRELVATALDSQPGGIATGISTLILFFMASGLVKQLHQSLNIYWSEVLEPGKPTEPKRPWNQRLLGTLWREARIRAKAFVVVLGFGLLPTGTILASVLLQVAAPYLPDIGWTQIGPYASFNRLLSFLSPAILFAVIYRFVPKATPPWRQILPGALAGGTAFALLQYLLGLYFQNAEVGSVYGAAGSLVVLLFWVYYSIQALFFGAAVVIVQTSAAQKPI